MKCAGVRAGFGRDAAGTLSLQGIVKAQLARGVWFVFDNYFFMIVPFAVY